MFSYLDDVKRQVWCSIAAQCRYAPGSIYRPAHCSSCKIFTDNCHSCESRGETYAVGVIGNQKPPAGLPPESSFFRWNKKYQMTKNTEMQSLNEKTLLSLQQSTDKLI